MDNETFKELNKTHGDYGIYRYLDISTCHITKSDSEALNFRVQPNGAHLIGSYSEGWVLSIGEFDPDETTRGRDYSEAFYEVIDYARKQGCQLVRLDADGMKFQFTRFDW